MDIMSLKEPLTLLGVSALRSIAGWATIALEDGKVSMPEWRLLGSTVVRVGLIAVCGYVGFNSSGIDVSAVSAALGAIVVDKIIDAIKSRVKK